MQLKQRKFFLVAFLSLVESIFAYTHSNNNVNIGVTINKNIYYIHSGQIANKYNWEKVLPKEGNVVAQSKPKPNSPGKKKKPDIGGGRISEVKGSAAVCKCGRTDVQEPLHFDYTSRLDLTQLAHLTKSFRFSQQAAAKSLGLDLSGVKLARPEVGGVHEKGSDYQVHYCKQQRYCE